MVGGGGEQRCGRKEGRESGVRLSVLHSWRTENRTRIGGGDDGHVPVKLLEPPTVLSGEIRPGASK